MSFFLLGFPHCVTSHKEQHQPVDGDSLPSPTSQDDLRRNVFVVALQQFVDEETGTEFLPVPEWRIIELYFQISPPMLV